MNTERESDWLNASPIRSRMERVSVRNGFVQMLNTCDKIYLSFLSRTSVQMYEFRILCAIISIY